MTTAIKPPSGAATQTVPAEILDGTTPYYHDTGAGIAIYHGDCRELLPLVPPGTMDLVLTDPPYRHCQLGGGFGTSRRIYHGDELRSLSNFDLGQYGDLLLAAAPMLIAFHSRDLIPDYAALATAAQRTYDLHVWYKQNAIPFTNNTWKSDLEYIALIWQTKPGWVQRPQREHSKLSDHPVNKDPLHPTAKPLVILKKYLLILDAQRIIDPFVGSGTTLRAAKDLHRTAIGIEIEERYCETAARRLSQEVFNFSAPPTVGGVGGGPGEGTN